MLPITDILFLTFVFCSFPTRSIPQNLRKSVKDIFGRAQGRMVLLILVNLFILCDISSICRAKALSAACSLRPPIILVSIPPGDLFVNPLTCDAWPTDMEDGIV